MYDLPQSGILANKLIARRLAIHGYHQTKFTLGLWYVRVVLVAVLSTVPYESLTPSTYVFSKEHILVVTVLRGVNDIDGTFL
jgi:hypothetical protein